MVRVIPVSLYPALLQNMLSEEMVGEIARVLRDYYQPYVLPISLLLLLSISPLVLFFLALIYLSLSDTRVFVPGLAAEHAV